jgi:anaerobic magnesium-protoporphyrin IX monomethyl ester cyclase
VNILLINPPAENELVGNNPPIIDEERGYNPPLGLLYIAAYLEKHSNHKIEVLDAQVEGIGYDELETKVAEKKPDVVGITTMTFTLIDVLKTVQLVKRVDENIRVVLGGPHVHLYPNETIDIPGVDYLVLGEGEVALAQLIEGLDDNDRLEKITGLVFKVDGDVVNTGIRDMIDNLDELPFPARHLTPYWRYSSLLAKRMPITTMFTSRGCPYRCAFCDRPHLGKKFRARTAENVADEMEECVNMGIHEFLVYDDTFTIDRQRVLDICDEIIRRKLDIGWDIRARVDTVTKDMLKRLREANCERIHYGVEAGTDRILKVLRKGITLEQARGAFKMTKEVGISTLAYFMIGSPTETRGEILQTIEFAQKLDPDFVHITILTPFPATAIYRKGLEEGVFESDFWREFAANPTLGFEPEYWEENLSREELLELVAYAYKSFYARPKYVIKELAQVRSLNEFMRKVKAGLKVLRL